VSVSLHRCCGRGRNASSVLRRSGAPKLPAGQHRPKQSMGQSYLTDPNYIAKIADSFATKVELCTQKTGGRTVLELGPGLGAITRPLLLYFPHMTAIELDDRAVALLRQDLPSLNVLHSDMTKVDYGELAQQLGGPLSVVGNLPYSIITDILLTLVDFPGAISYAQFMVQKEVADRIVATPGSRAYGVLSVALQLYAKPARRFTVPATAFYPRPKVTSAVVDLHFRAKGEVPGMAAPTKFLEVLRTAFSQRRKKLRHSLRPLLDHQRCGLPSDMEGLRAEQVTPEGFAQLTDHIFPYARPAGPPSR